MTNFQPIKNNELSTFNSFTLEDTENENKESITLIEEATINSEDEKEEILDEEELRKKYRQVQIYNGSLEGISNKEMIESNGNFINGICENFISAMIKLSDIFQKNLSISAYTISEEHLAESSKPLANRYVLYKNSQSKENQCHILFDQIILWLTHQINTNKLHNIKTYIEQSLINQSNKDLASLLFIFQRGISAQNTSNVDKKISSLTGSIYRRVKSVLQQQQSTNSTDIMKAKVLGYEIPEITANTKMLYALISFIDTKTYSTELSSTLKLIVQYETLVQYEDFLNETIFKSKNNKNYLNKIKNIFLKIDSSLNELNISSKDKKEIQESLNKIRSPNYPKEAFKKLKNCLTYDIANNYLLPYDNSSDCYSFNKSFEYYKTLIDCNLPIPLL